jgi:hypothetical protein
VGVLEEFLGKPLTSLTDAELEEWSIKGRVARELESVPKEKKEKAVKEGKKPKFNEVLSDIDLDDFE